MAAIAAYFARSAGSDVAEVTAKTSMVGTLSGIAGLGLSITFTVAATHLPSAWRFPFLLAAYASLIAARLAVRRRASARGPRRRRLPAALRTPQRPLAGHRACLLAHVPRRPG